MAASARTRIVTGAEEGGPTECRPEHQFYLWNFPGSPVRVFLSLAVVLRMREQWTRAIGPEWHGEAGGLLMGTQRSSHNLEVTDFVPIPCVREDQRFLISESDKPRFKAAIDKATRPAGEISVVGFYKQDIRGDIRLCEEDLALIHEFFRHPSNVFMVVGRGEDGGPAAGFFFWNAGVVFGEMAFLSFPLDERLLAPCKAPVAVELPLAAATNAAPDASVAAKPPAAVVKDPAAPLWQRVLSSVLAGTALVTILAAGALVIYPRISGTKPARQPAGVMGLAATLTGNEVVISWDSNSPAITDAGEGVLRIRDGSVRRELPLTKSMLSARNLVYKALGESMQVELEIHSAAGESTRETVLVLLKVADQEKSLNPISEPIALVKSSIAAAVKSPEKTPSAINRVVTNGTRIEAIGTEPVVTAAQRTPPPFVLPAAAGVAGQGVKEVPGPTTVPAPDLNPPSRPLSTTLDSTVDVLKPSAPPMPAPTTARGNSNSEKLSGSPAPAPVTELQPLMATVPPKPTRQVKPELPANVKTFLGRTTEIQVKVSVDETGKVTLVEPPLGKGVGGILAAAAATAAKQWKFEPATRAGRAVPSEIVLRFRFTPRDSR